MCHTNGFRVCLLGYFGCLPDELRSYCKRSSNTKSCESSQDKYQLSSGYSIKKVFLFRTPDHRYRQSSNMPTSSVFLRSAHITSSSSDKLDLIVNLVLGLLGVVLSIVTVWQGYWIWRIWKRAKEERSDEESTNEERGEEFSFFV